MGYPIWGYTGSEFSFSFSCLVFSFLASLNTCPNTVFFSNSPTIQENEEFVWLARNLKWEVTKYSKRIYGLGGFSYPGGGDDDDDGDNGDGGAGGTETTPSY